MLIARLITKYNLNMHVLLWGNIQARIWYEIVMFDVMDEYLLRDKILIMYFGGIPVVHQLQLMETHYVQEERVIC